MFVLGEQKKGMPARDMPFSKGHSIYKKVYVYAAYWALIITMFP